MLRDKISGLLSNTNVASLKKDFLSISSAYRKENISSKLVVTKDSEVLSYLSTRMCATTSVIYKVLDTILKVADFDVESMLDVGSGTGSALWAIDNIFPGIKVTALEIEDSMLKYSKILSSDLTLDVDYIKGNILSKTTSDKLPISNLVIESFMLNELTDVDRLKAVDVMLSKTNDYLVLIEPGTPKSYERMMTIKDYVINKGLSLILPCANTGKCPLQNDYCNFSVRVERASFSRLVKSGSLSHEDEKYFYLVFRKNNTPLVKNNSIVLRHPKYRKNCVDLKLCNASGVKDVTITKSNKDIYKLCRDVSHWDVITFGI